MYIYIYTHNIMPMYNIQIKKIETCVIYGMKEIQCVHWAGNGNT